MTLRERMTTALDGNIPDSVLTFELEFQLEEEMFGKTFDYSKISEESILKYTPKEKDIVVNQYHEHWADLYINKLEYSSVPVPLLLDFGSSLDSIRKFRKYIGNSAMIHGHGDGTFAIPDGNRMYDFAYRMADEPEELVAEALRNAQAAIERNKLLIDAGVDCLILCSDYCYNNGPFISPEHFEIYIQPYLAMIIESARKEGAYTIKHTDGNIMRILDMLVQTNPHAIHSLDPMAKVDIAEVKRLVGDKVALCGNVNCALMQTGTDEEVIASAEYSMNSGKPGGGYIYCTSNVPFKGLPVERYKLILNVWRRMRKY